MKMDFGSLNLRSDEVTYTYKGKTYRLSSHPYEPCLYLWKGDKLACTLHNAYNPEQLVEAFTAGKTVKTNFGKDYDKEYDETGICRVLAAALDSGRVDMDFFYAAKLAKGRSPLNSGLELKDMYELKNDELDKIIEKEEPEGVDFFLMADERTYSGIESHRAAILFAMHLVNENEKQTIKKAEELFGKEYADRMHLFTCDISKAKAKRIDPQELLFVPDILRKDYYGNKKYDSDWVPNDENCGKQIPYWYAFLEPPHGTRYRPEDLRRINAALFPDGAEGLVAYEWTTDWSDIFDDGHEWWGASCWSVYDSHRNRFVVLLASATD